MERVRIAVLDAYDNVLAFMDNGAPKAMHYYEDELHEYLKGTANTLTFCAGAKHEDAQYLVEGNKLSFLYRGKEYYLNIMSVRRDELEVEVTAYSLSFELLNEEKEKYAATEAKTFAQYLEIFDSEHIITLGNNEVSDKSIKHEWEGSSTLLARLFSLATVFSAEVEFVSQLNNNYSLKAIVMNAYKEHSDTIQGIGVNRNDITLRYGKNVTGITKTSDITGLYTAIRPFGRDGLTITDLDKAEYDADGNLEYYTESGSNNILAPQARDRFPSNLWSAKDRYIAKVYEYDTDNVNVLYGNALSELKKNCVPQVEYEVSGYFDTDIGDTVQIEDDEYNPALYLEARVTEQIRSFTDLTRNKTTFDNFHELQSQLDSDLVAKMNALIEQNKTYTCMISTDNGTTFKNNTGSTTLTASVRDGVTDVTDKFTIAWSKDGADLANGKSITVNAADVDGKALYRFDAKDSNGNEKGFYEVTITDVNDGKDGEKGDPGENGADGKDGVSSYTHIKYSDDGKTFTEVENYASSNRNDWLTGYYGAGSTTSEEQPNKATDSYKSISMEKVIQIDPNETYQCSSGHDNVKLYFTLYDADGMYSKLYNPGAESFKFASGVSAVRMYLTCANSSIVSSLESWDELFSSGEVNPVFKMRYASEGDKPGAWMGTMTSDSPVASTEFSDYTWKKIEGDPTGIVESADEPSDKYVGMLWKNTGTTSGLVQGATYRWTGTEWEMYKFSATNIEAETFKGYEFDGSIFKSDFVDDVSPYNRYVGSMHIQDGYVKIDTEWQAKVNLEDEWSLQKKYAINVNYRGIGVSEGSSSSETTEETWIGIDEIKKLAAISDYIVEEIGDEKNGYRKWASGKMEQWVSFNRSVTINNAWGGCYISAVQAEWSYDVAFKSAPFVVMSASGNGTDAAWIMQLSAGTASAAPKFHLVRGAALTTSQNFKIHIHAWGMWK